MNKSARSKEQSRRMKAYWARKKEDGITLPSISHPAVLPPTASKPLVRDRICALQLLMEAKDVNAEQALSVMNRIMATVLQ